MGILQARILEWVAISFSRGSSWPRDWTPISHISGGFCHLALSGFLLWPHPAGSQLTRGLGKTLTLWGESFWHRAGQGREGIAIWKQTSLEPGPMPDLITCNVCLRRQWHPTPVLLPGKSHGRRGLVGCSPWGRSESDMTERFHFHALEKEMATHSSVLAWRIPGTGEPGGLPSMGSHRVGHNWSDLAAAGPWQCFSVSCL